MGKVFTFGDNIDTDLIIPARYLNSSELSHLAAHCMEDADATFAKKVSNGDIIVGGENFGCGSSREHAPIAIKACGVKAVIAKSFARIFYRNAINIGLSILESTEAANSIQSGDALEINFESGIITNLTKNETYYSKPYPPFIKKIIDKGGLLNCISDFQGEINE